MSQAVGNIHVNLVVNTGGASRFTSAANVIGRDSNRMRTALDGTSRSVSSLRMQTNRGMRSRLLQDMVRQATAANNEIGLLRSTMLGLAAITGTSLTGAFAGTYLLQTADQAHLLSNQLRTVTTDSENLAAVQERLYALSQQTRSGMESTIKVYARTARATEHLGYSQENLVRITETIQKAFAVGGASTQEAMGAAIQLSQGIASDRFSGEEFRSVAENAPVLLKAMADSLDVTIGKLREMAHAGQLTADVVTQAILDASASVDSDFEKMGVTVGQAMTRVHNAFLMYIGDVDKSQGITAQLSTALTNLAENFGDVAHWAGIAIATIAGVAGGKMFGSLAGGLLGNTVGQYTQMRKMAAENLADLRRQEVAMRGQQTALRSSIDLHRQKLTAIVNQRHAVNATSKDIQRSYALEKKELARLTQLRMQSLGLARSQAMAVNQIAIAQARATRVAAGFNALRTVGSGILGFMGGWTGVAFTAAIAGMIAIANSGMKAAARTEQVKKELHELGLISDEVAGHVETVTKSIDELADDEIRNKLRVLREEIQAIAQEQGFLDRVFNYNPQNIGNIISGLQMQLADAQAFFDPNNKNLRFEFTADGIQATQSLLDLAERAREGDIASEELTEELNRLAAANPQMGAWFDQAVSDLRMAAPYLEAMVDQVGRLSAELSNIGDVNPILRTVEAQRQYAEAIARSAEAAELLSGIVDEDIRVALLSEDAARLEEAMADIRKEWEKIAEESDEQLTLNDDLLRSEALRLIAAEDLAEAQKTSREAVQEYASEIQDLIRALDSMPEMGDNADAVANVRILVREFIAGQRTASDLHAELEAIAGTNVSGGMAALIGRIQAAIPLAQSLRSILSAASFGMAFGGGGRGDTGAAADAFLQKQIEASLKTSKEQEFDSLVETYMQQAGVIRSEAEATAKAVIANREALDAASDSASGAADATEQYAEGVAELQRELDLSSMDKFWGDVVSAAEGLGIATEEVDAFIAAVQSGGLDAAPEKFRKIAEAMREINFNETMRDLEFDQAQFGRGELQQNIYETLRDTGIEYHSVQGQIIARQMVVNHTLDEANRFAKQLTETISSGLADMFLGILDGSKSASESIGDLLRQLGSLLVHEAFRLLISGGTGGGFNILSLLGFDAGGYTGNLPDDKVAGVVHGGEYVFSAKAVDRLGIGYLESLHGAARGYQDGGYVSNKFSDIQGGLPGLPKSGGHLDVRIINEVINGDLRPTMIEVAGEVSGQQIRKTVPAAMATTRAQAAKDTPSALAQFQRQRQGSDYRTM